MGTVPEFLPVLLAPKHFDLVECYHLMEGLANLMPKLLSELLVECSSIKVKRLFLYMAEKKPPQMVTIYKNRTNKPWKWQPYVD